MQRTGHSNKPIPPTLKKFSKIVFLATGLVYTFYELSLFARDIRKHWNQRNPR